MHKNAERATLRSILFADLAQYSRLTAANELRTVDFVGQCFALFQDHCEEYGGEFIKTTGDGVLILFENVTGAIDYALFMQKRLDVLMDGALPSRFRIGLHVGEVLRRNGDAFGHAINVAARVQGLKRHYALIACGDGKVRLIKALDGDHVLGVVDFRWAFETAYRFEVTMQGRRIRAAIDGKQLFDVTDNDRPLEGGAVALVCEEGRLHAGPVGVRPVEGR